MAWTAPTTQATGTLITAAIWNTDLTDNLAYLKTQTDLIDDCIYTIYPNGGARAINGTDYQNSTKIRIVSISAYNSVTGDAKSINLYACVKVSSPPDSLVAESSVVAGASVAIFAHVTFVVPPLYYYDCTGAATDTPTLISWTEWDLH